ncbi:hypothetical protein [Anaerorhabdus sp.]|uniref:hypothetical protein n=1 Tax=Anaerorhabdus sp. TaxID=1872524 RepID=UPI002FCAD64C
MDEIIIDEELCKDVMQYLRIDDDIYENEVTNFIKSSITYFKTKTSDKFDYTKPYEKSILMDRVRYQFSRATNEFESDFLSELITLEELYE